MLFERLKNNMLTDRWGGGGSMSGPYEIWHCFEEGRGRQREMKR